jgi:hypothetical protein
MQPCPGCGLYQYDMIAQRRAKSRMQFFVIGLIAFAIILIVNASYEAQTNTLTWIATAVAGFLVAANLLLELQNSNSDLTANLALAQQRVADGKLKSAPGESLSQSAVLAQPTRTPVHLLALLLLVVSLPLVISPELIRSVRGWPLNEDCYPPVVGAGDSTRIYLHDTITSIKGYWRGSPRVWLHYDSEPMGGVEVSAVANQNNWGSQISDVKSSEEHDTSHPWVEVTLPDSAGLANKKVKCDIDLSLEYPQMTGSGTFRTMSSHMRHQVDIHLAPRGAGHLYNSQWWTGTAGGGALLLAAILLLYSQAKAFGRLAKPTQVFAAQ